MSCAPLFMRFPSMLKRQEILLSLWLIGVCSLASSQVVDESVCPHKVAENIIGMEPLKLGLYKKSYDYCLTFKVKSNSKARDRSTTLKWFQAEIDACLEMFPNGRVSPLKLLTDHTIDQGSFPENVTKTIVTADIVSLVTGPVLKLTNGSLIEYFSMYHSEIKNGKMTFREKSCYYNKSTGEGNCDAIDPRLASRTELLKMSKNAVSYCGMAELEALDGTVEVIKSWFEPCSEVLEKQDEYICAHRPYFNCDYVSRILPCHRVNNSNQCIEQTNYYIWKFDEKPYGQVCPTNKTAECNCSKAVTLNLNDQPPICQNEGQLHYRPDGSIFCWCRPSNRGKACQIEKESLLTLFLLSALIIYFIVMLYAFLYEKIVRSNKSVKIVKMTPVEKRCHVFDHLRFTHSAEYKKQVESDQDETSAERYYE
ncbi:hypothetical protein T07_4094 [Trichinella nelsoni]|uniref:EGF-like domain-containing protein n=1 Tax=Trichinella nelsoni TaxID=6336 RepID=A0A0V0RWX5_9BILA|nr:hypothetical protein T07_4094 [Trichinella nelsoni]